MKLCFSSVFLLLFFPSGWSHPLPAYHSPQHRLLKLACGVSSGDADTSHTCQVDWRQSRAVCCSLHSLALSACLSLSLSLSLFPLWVSARQDLVSLQPASQPDSYVGEPDWLSTESDVKSCLPRSSLHGSQLGGCMLCCSLQCSLGDDWSNLLICLRGTVRFLLLRFCLKPSFQCGLQARTEMIQ